LPEPRGSSIPPAGPSLPSTVLGPVSPDGARAIGGQPVIATPGQTMPDAERADALEQRFRVELPLSGLDGEWDMLDRADLAELIQLARAADLTILGQYPGGDSSGATSDRGTGRKKACTPPSRFRDSLLSRAADLGADMIVTGAYHHSRLRESLLVATCSIT
jgi:hypothetical protein